MDCNAEKQGNMKVLKIQLSFSDPFAKISGPLA